MKKAVFLFSFIILQTLSMAQTKSTLIYIGDPMCSWCYGFSPELTEVLAEFEGRLDFKIVMGGLRPYNEEKINTMKDFLSEHWQHVQEASGQVFNFEILENSSFSYDTEPPSRAIVVIRQIKPEIEMAFFKDVQQLFYEFNRDTSKPESYFPLLKKYKIEQEQFLSLFHSEEVKLKVREDFNYAQELGVKGFPSIILQHSGEHILVSNGYAKSKEMTKRLEQILN